MNELQMVDELYDDPPGPSTHTVAAARIRMTGEEVVRAKKGWRLTFGLGLGLVAAGTAAVVAIATTGQGPGTPDQPGQARQPEELSARQILLAAAESSTKTPLTGGTYWLTHIQLGVAMVAGTGPDRYVVERRDERKQWRGVGRPARSASRGLGTRPQTPADVAKWKRAGSPKQFPRGWPAQGTPWQTRTGSPSDDGPFPRAYLNGLRNLPTDPVKLRANLLKEQKTSPADRNAPAARWLFFRGSELLVAPVPPRVRAATYKMLAGLPGIRTVGRVTDPLGRSGPAVGMLGALLQPVADEQTETQLVVDPKSGRLLTSRTVLVRPMSRPMPGMPMADAWRGVVLSYEAYVTAAWVR